MAGATSVRKLSDAQLLDFERFLDAAPKYYVWGVGCLMSSIRGEQVSVTLDWMARLGGMLS